MEKFNIPSSPTTLELTIEEVEVEPIEIPFELTPREFLTFAKEDLKTDGLRSFVNALSNAKRAIDCQLDSLIYCYGLFKTSDREKWTFPKKIDILNKIGLEIPNIVMKVNTSRVELEHKYKKPDRHIVEDWVDVAELFIKSTEAHYGFGVKEIYAKGGNVSAKLEFDRNKEEIKTTLLEHTEILTPSEIERYFELLKLIASLNKDINVSLKRKARIKLT